MDRSNQSRDHLKHYGVLGMKWGIRKDRNGNYGPSSGSSSGSESADSKKATAAKAKVASGGIKTLSNDELRDLVNRINLEQQYTRLQTQPHVQGRGKKFISDVGSVYLKQQALKAANTGTSLVVKQALKKRK